MSKYDPMQRYLNSEVKITLTYSEIENILGFKLPESAYKHREWWANGSHSHSNMWIGAGWKVDSVELGEHIIFKRLALS
ncbi:DUF7662 domain-containing protein [Brevibacillus dissolubilis]|uniref:DUF7662 domain-containing protein n=1 Tax=Brevibacillus dissolubilis TaxID=1844116 RepID=UPI001117A6A4|nr:hypothetical protein [Brevibacillus dissolubilis]